MSPPINECELIEVLRSWVRPRLYSFPLWDFDEILNEAYLAAHPRLSRWDPARGSLATYLHCRLYDPVHRRYLKANGYSVSRPLKNKKKQKRITHKKELLSCDLKLGIPDHSYQIHTSPYRIDWDNAPAKAVEIIILLGLGYNLTQIGKSIGLSYYATRWRMKNYTPQYLIL